MAEESDLTELSEVTEFGSVVHSKSIRNLALALAKAQGQIKGAVKDSTNPFFNSRYADLQSVWEACREPLSKNQLSVVQLPGASDKVVQVFTYLLHESGEYIGSELVMIPVKPDPQGIGSCISYARRYALASIVGIYQADDDANVASGKSREAASPQPRTNPQNAPKSSEPASESKADSSFKKIEGVLFKVEAKKTTADKPFATISLVGERETYSTFDTNTITSLNSLKGKKVGLEYVINDKGYRNIKDFYIPLEEAGKEEELPF